MAVRRSWSFSRPPNLSSFSRLLGRQEVAVGALDDRGDLLHLALQRLGRGQEAVEGGLEAFLAEFLLAGEQRLAPGAADQRLDVGARDVADIGHVGHVLASSFAPNFFAITVK
jgi:hypothetical protein